MCAAGPAAKRLPCSKLMPFFVKLKNITNAFVLNPLKNKTFWAISCSRLKCSKTVPTRRQFGQIVCWPVDWNIIVGHDLKRRVERTHGGLF